MANKNLSRFEFRLTDSKRDKRIAAWLGWLLDEGHNASEAVKLLIDEAITGRSSGTGRPIQYQGDVPMIKPDDPVADAIGSFDD